MLALVSIATRQMNCEVFVLDAGWYTTEGVEDLGENWVDPHRRLGGQQAGAVSNGISEDFSDACREPPASASASGSNRRRSAPWASSRREHPDWLHFCERTRAGPGQAGPSSISV